MDWVFVGTVFLARIAVGTLFAYFGLALGTFAAIESVHERRLGIVAVIYFLVGFLPVYAIAYISPGKVGWTYVIVEILSFFLLLFLLIYLSRFPPPKALLIAVYARLLILGFSFLSF